ncbi:MAG: N-acetylmuramoyl-L-alanine amidase [Acidobacteria bacterium]|nr:N-acetylmuramoyl-L-alanine amidase [Acidobacteriota bacterium]
MGKLKRVKRRLVSGAVSDNLETIRGFGPWTLRRRHAARAWLRRTYMVLLPLSLLASTLLVSAVTGEFPFDKKHVVPAVASTTAVTVASSRPLAAPRAQQQPPAPMSADRVFTELPVPIDVASLNLSVRRVILDAGHGGSDPGTVSGDLLEKDITLDINARLERMLKQANFDVQVTRQEDRTVPLRARASIANDSSGDIFVSIHVNSIRGSHAIRGIETYYLGPTDDPILNELAASENRGSGYTLSDYRRLLEGIYADVRRDESRALAESIQRNLHGDLVSVNPHLENWGVRKAPFVVLVATEMPAILAEVACLSNKDEAKLLATDEYRQQIADALFKGIVAYARVRGGEAEKGI